MKNDNNGIGARKVPYLKDLPTPVKALLSALICTLALAMFGAFWQIIVHDVVPTFSEKEGQSLIDLNRSVLLAHLEERHVEINRITASGIVDKNVTTDEVIVTGQSEPFYTTYPFISILKWSHVHLFGMAFIFILLGCVTVMLPYSSRLRVWLIVLPFIGLVIDIASVWMKNFVSPVFFWMHLPGGGTMFTVFGFVALAGLREMWLRKS